MEKKSPLAEADFYLKKVTITEYQRERPLWKAVAGDARIFQEKDLAFLNKFQAVFYQEDGRTVNFQGNQGRVRLSSMDISVRGDVRAETEDGTRLFTKNFTWNNKKRRASTNDPVRIIRDNIRMEGIGLELDPDRQVITIKKQVHTFIGKGEG